MKSAGTSISARIETVPPSTNAPQRRRAGEPRERHEHERGDRDRAGAADHLGGEPVAGARERTTSSPAYLRERAALLGLVRVVREGLVDERPQPEEREQRRDDRGGERDAPTARHSRQPHERVARTSGSRTKSA